MRRHITRALYAVAAAGIASLTVGFAGAGATATAAPRSLGPPVYTAQDAGYVATGRWFRYVETTVTVPPVTPSTNGCNMIIGLHYAAPMGPRADILVGQGGGAGSVGWGWGGKLTPFAVSPKVGDQLRIGVYYDRHGHTSFTATDVTQGVTRTVRVHTGTALYNEVSLAGNAGSGPVLPPAADTRLWAISGTRLTTYTGTRGTLTGPWQTSQQIQTSTGTAVGTVMRSPSGLWNGGANFGVWLRALPLVYTASRAAYQDIGGPFRFVATTLTVPPAQVPAANGGSAGVGLIDPLAPVQSHANISVWPGGGPGSVRYDSYSESGTFTVTPQVGDQLAISVYYDQHGHYQFTVTDTTQNTSQTVTVNTIHPYPLREANLGASFDNQAVVPPPADTRLWQFTGSHVTTDSGDHGTILGPWPTSWWIDTTNGTPAGAVVADAKVLSNGGQAFSVWLRHH